MSRWIYSLSKQQTHTIMTHCPFLMIATFFAFCRETKSAGSLRSLLDLFRKIKVAVVSLFARVMIDTFFGILLRNKIRVFIVRCNGSMSLDKNWMMVSKGSPFISYSLSKWPTQLAEWSNVSRKITKKEIYERYKFFYPSASKKREKTAYPAVGGAASLNTLFHLPPSPPLIHYPAIGVPNGHISCIFDGNNLSYCE